MSNALVTYDATEAVATVTINRPHLMNALSCEAADALRAAIERARSDDAVRAIVMTGTGKAFCTGFDLKSIDLDGEISLGAVLDDHFHPLVRALRAVPKPVISAINGPVAGVGVAIALAGDITIASANAYFLEPFVNIAAVPDGGNSFILPRLAGTARAAGMMMLGEKVPAIQAADWGLVWKTVPADAFAEEIAATAQKLVRLPDGALAEIKRVLAASSSNDFEAQIALERDAQDALGRSPEFRAAIDRFAGGR